MNKQQLTSRLKLISVLLSVFALSACTYKVSNGVADDGSTAKQIIFPAHNKAWIKNGTFPNRENLSKIAKNVTKEDLYDLLGAPHFSEAQHAREWDYIFKFRNPKSNAVEICRYKVLFDKNMLAQSFYWYPSVCANYAKIPKNHVVVTPETVKVKKKRINLSADALFEFNQYDLEYMLPVGRDRLNKIAEELVRMQQEHDTRIMITGHTDYLGDDIYNLNLSQLRAQTVRAYLISHGVLGSTVSATGAGETIPVKQCSQALPRNQLIDCLQPNRRVMIDVAYY